MYDVEKLISIVSDFLEAETEDKKFNLEIRKKMGLQPDSSLWGPSLNGSDSYRLGELSERSSRSGWILSDICIMLDIDQDRLISTVKSMQRWERRRWHLNEDVCLIGSMQQKDKEHLMQYLKKSDEWTGHFKSTGRKLPWCA